MLRGLLWAILQLAGMRADHGCRYLLFKCRQEEVQSRHKQSLTTTILTSCASVVA